MAQKWMAEPINSRSPGDHQAAIARAGGDEHGPRAVLLARRRADAQVLVVAPQVLHARCLQDFDAELLRLPGQPLGKFLAGNTFVEAGVILHVLRVADVPPGRAALEDQRLDAFTSRVDRGRQACRSAADDDQVVEVVLSRGDQAQLLSQRLIARLGQGRAVGKDDRGHAAIAVVDPHYFGLCGRVLVDIDIVIRHAVFAEKLLAAPAVGAPRRPVDDQWTAFPDPYLGLLDTELGGG